MSFRFSSRYDQGCYEKNKSYLAFGRIYFPWRFLGCLLLLAILSGCAMIKNDTMRNEPLPYPMEAAIPTRASQNITIDDLPNGVFIGIALSGGGSRAGNFSAAAMLELEDLGILQKTSVISSVLGSSLVAAYYL
jgi:NTE family protein